MPQKTNFACDEREPLFEKRRCKWHFFSKKVCYVVILHYLCIRKRGREVASFGFVLGSLCLRSGFALGSLLRVEAKRSQKGMKKTSMLYKVRAERACSLCRAEQRHGVTLYKVRAERALSLCRAEQRHEVPSPIRLSDDSFLIYEL